MQAFNGAREVALITDINRDAIAVLFVLLDRMNADQ